MSRPNKENLGAPLLLAVLTIVGLTSALLGDDIWDLVSAVTLGAPVAVGAWYSLRRSRSRTPA